MCSNLQTSGPAAQIFNHQVSTTPCLFLSFLHGFFRLAQTGTKAMPIRRTEMLLPLHSRNLARCIVSTEDSVSRHGWPCLLAHGRRGFSVCDSLSQQELCVRLGYWFVSANKHSSWSSVSLLVFSNTGYKVWSTNP